MKFLCPQCERLVELRDFKLEGATLVLTCPACLMSSRVTPGSSPPMALVPLVPVTTTGERPALQLTSFPGVSNVVALRTPGADAVQSAAEAARTAPLAIPEGRCPKCISLRAPESKSCAYCGLTFAQFDPSQVEPPAWLKTAWVEVLSHWDLEDQHVALRQRALQEQELPAVGRLYRLRLAVHAEDPIAQRGRDEVLRLALIRSAPPKKVTLNPALKYTLVALVLAGVLVVLVLMARKMLELPG